jgi:hypothetical protein
MSSALEDRAQVAAMLAEEGVAITITRNVAGTYDPSTGTSTAPSQLVKTGRGRFGSYRDSLVDGTLIKRGDRRVTFQPDDWSFAPASTDQITVPAGWSIVGEIQKRELGGVPFSYTFQVRGPAEA